LNWIYIIGWRFCSREKDREHVFQNWLKEYQQFQQTHPYQKKYLFLFIQCDFYLLSSFDQNAPAKRNGNALCLTKMTSTNDYRVHFLKDSRWMKDRRSIVIENLNLGNIQIDQKSGLIDLKKLTDQ
jgi:hypothetical protein